MTFRERYPIGLQFDAPDPDSTLPVSVTVTGYWNNTMSRDVGVDVATEDGREFSISASYLDEDGGGVYTRGGPRPGAGRKPNAIPSHTIVVHATTAERAQIMALSPRERTEKMLA